MSEKLTKKPSYKPLSQQEERLTIYHSPIFLDDTMSASQQLDQIFCSLKRKQKWLANQPLEAILGLINEARKSWSSTPELDPYRHTGLNFLADWCEPNRLKNLLDSALNGQRAFWIIFTS